MIQGALAPPSKRAVEGSTAKAARQLFDESRAVPLHVSSSAHSCVAKGEGNTKNSFRCPLGFSLKSLQNGYPGTLKKTNPNEIDGEDQRSGSPASAAAWSSVLALP